MAAKKSKAIAEDTNNAVVEETVAPVVEETTDIKAAEQKGAAAFDKLYHSAQHVVRHKSKVKKTFAL